MRIKKVVILDNRFPHHTFEKDTLLPAGAEIIVNGDVKTEKEIIPVVRDADVILVNLPPITAGIISNLRNCRGIVRYGTGFDSVDIRAASEKNIMVVNVPDYCTEEVSDQVLALLFACVRQVAARDRLIRDGFWDSPPIYPVTRIAGKTMGLLGYGRVARVLHRKLSGLGLGRVLVNDPFVPVEIINNAGAESVDFHTLLAESDFLSLHTPLTGSTHQIFNTDTFQAMKPGAILINTARGGLIKTPDLIRALEDGRLRAAGLDVHEAEPLPSDSSLLVLRNAVLSDHRSWYSSESTDELQKKAASAAREILEGNIPENTVNRALLRLEQ